MDKTKKMYDAYMTLEASFIMPLAVFLIAALMYLSFYLYTVSFLNQAAYVSAFRGSLCEPDSGRMKRQQSRNWKSFWRRGCCR